MLAYPRTGVWAALRRGLRARVSPSRARTGGAKMSAEVSGQPAGVESRSSRLSRPKSSWSPSQ